MDKPKKRTRLLVATGLALTLSLTRAEASTAAFCGEVTAVLECPRNQKDCVRPFTVRIDYYDYVSWGKFNRDSEVGEPITRRVKTVGSVCVIDGHLTNRRTFAGALRPGTWGYFYEDTWLDLSTTPQFQWGEVVAVDVGSRRFTLRTHRTHKLIHLDANPPVETTIEFDAETGFRLEETPAEAARVLAAGNWVQVHEPRPQIVSVWTPESAFDPSELQPQAEGRRGLANDLSCAAVLESVRLPPSRGKKSKSLEVVDIAADVTATRLLRNRQERVTLNCRKTTFVLDGKVCPPQIAMRPGHRAVLGHYRKEKTPHKILVRSFDDAIRGTARDVGDDTLRVETTDGSSKESTTLRIDADARLLLDGRLSSVAEALKAGRDVVVHPRRSRTIIGFAPAR